MKILLIFILLVVYNTVCGQSHSGIVVDASGSAIEAASLTNTRTKLNAVTDEKGRFTIGMLAGDTLIVRHVNFTMQRWRYTTGSSPVVITLSGNFNTLQEVTVSSGYQQVSKERMTGSFEKIDTKTINLQAGTDILSRLNGTSTVFFDNNAVRSSGRSNIYVRGISTINGLRDPLIILDNFPYEGDFQNINPNDIDNITILKDAAAASIWGARAANGVIVITSKKAKINQPVQMDVTANVTVRNSPDLFYKKPISSSDYIDVEQFLYGKGFYNSNISNTTTRPALSPVIELLVRKANGQLAAADADAQLNALRSVDVRNDFNRYIYSTAVNQQYNIALRTSSAKTALMFSAGFDKNLSELSAHANRKTIGIHLSLYPVRKLTLTASLNYTDAATSSGKTGYDNYSAIANNQPYIQYADAGGNALPVYRTYRKGYIDTAGQGKLLDWRMFPLEEWKYNRASTETQDILANIGINYSLIPGLSIDLRYNYERQTVKNIGLKSIESFAARSLINLYTQINFASNTVKYNVPKGAIQDMANSTLLSDNARVQINFDKKWKQHEFNSIAGGEIRNVNTAGNSFTVYGLNETVLTAGNVDFVNSYPTYVTGATSFIPSNQTFSDLTNRFVSLYANASYTYGQRYSVTASARRDASNLFGVNTNDKWQPLWSLGGAWDVSKELFYKLKLLSYLRIRITHGVSGNVDVRRSAVSTISYDPNVNPITGFVTAGIGQSPNPELRWEKTAVTNAAVDFATGNRRLSGALELYVKKGTDLLGPTPLDWTTGLQTITKNVASMKGNGVELLLNFAVVRSRQPRGFDWNTSWQYNYASTTVTDYFITNLNGSAFLNTGTLISPLVGKPVYAIYSFPWRGLNSSGDPVGLANGTNSTDYAAITGSGTKVTDLVYHGSALPVTFGFLRNTFSYKGFSLSVNLTYKLGYYFRKASTSYTTLYTSGQGYADFADRWKSPGDEARTNVPAMIYPAVSTRDAFYLNSETLVRKGDHIRLQFVSLSYDMGGKKQSSVKNAQVYINASNLGILWRANKDGIDPDYPDALIPATSATAGIRISF